VRLDDWDVLDVHPQGVLASAGQLRARSLAVAAQRPFCDGIDVVRGDPSVAAGLTRFASMWGSAVTALSRELDLLGVELGKSADAVVAADRAGAR
jgi:hypothetical protein